MAKTKADEPAVKESQPDPSEVLAKISACTMFSRAKAESFMAKANESESQAVASAKSNADVIKAVNAIATRLTRES